MANPYGSIAGVSDQSQSGWQDRLMGKVRETGQVRRKDSQRTSKVQIACDDEFVTLMHAAARGRDMAAAAYARRAIAAFIAHDLDMPIEEILRYAPKASNWADPYSRKTGERTADDGKGFGEWVVQ